MASTKKVTLENLQALGPERLAGLLLEFADGDPATKRRLRLELAAESGAGAVAADISKRLASIKRATSFVDWTKRKAFLRDLDLQRQMIVEKVAPTDPREALELMWRFMDLTESVLERADDSQGDVGDVFRSACHDLGTVATNAAPEPTDFADRVFDAVTDSGYGQFDELITVVFPALGKAGAEHLKHRVSEALARLTAAPDGYDYEANSLRRNLQEIADGEGDVDAFIAEMTPEHRKIPTFAAEAASRLVAVGRAREAHPNSVRSGMRGTWDRTWIAALEATGETATASEHRWACFERGLDQTYLREYLAALPDFDDVQAEEKALDFAEAYPNISSALSFLVAWPAHERAARLVIQQYGSLDGDMFHILGPAADALEGRFPLSAVLLRRAMIEHTLDRAKSTRYRHGARHVLECESLELDIPDHGAFETHETFMRRIKERHGRKTSFWTRLAEA